jgi:hypothetical protein
MADTSQFTIGTEASCSDGPAGKVSRVIVDPIAEKVTHIGRVQWSRREVAIPIGAVESTVDGIQLNIAKQEVQDLPSIDIDHPDRSTGRT